MKSIQRAITAYLLVLIFILSAAAAPGSVIVGGNIVGLKVQSDGVTIVEFTEKAPQQVGLKRGDILQKIDGISIKTVQEVAKAVEESEGRPLKLTVLRGSETKEFILSATQTTEGKKLGILVRDEVTGVGTLTYYDPQSGTFGALGHGISDGTTLLPVSQGEVLDSQVAAVTKGKSGKPGCLQGMVCSREKNGEILKNTPQGIFGTMQAPQGTELPIAERKEIQTGKATILSNVRGKEVRQYDVQILEIYPNEKNDRNLLIKITDHDLLEQTGGIVQGMSGSPIIQNGKLIGAVTHVLIDDPTRGYGIFIENMMQAANQAA